MSGAPEAVDVDGRRVIKGVGWDGRVRRKDVVSGDCIRGWEERMRGMGGREILAEKEH